MSSSEGSAAVFAPFRTQLLETARASIRCGLREGRALIPDLTPGPLAEPGACFVTLHLQENLRGCIGTLEAHRPLLEDVAHNAYGAAFRDPRFTPVSEREMEHLHLHLSVLHAPQPLSCDSERELQERLQPGVHGLIFQAGSRRATFLPSVWESLPDPESFVRQLKLKAGLAPDYWSEQVRLWTYTTESIE